jgi:uncharacterized protein
VPRGNVDIVQSVIEAAPDWDKVRSMLHPDARLDQSQIPDGGVFEGREAFGHFFRRWFDTWDDLRITPERFIENGDRVLALVTVEGRGKSSGVLVTVQAADIWTVREGKIVSLVGYPDRDEALLALGVSEPQKSGWR